MMGRTSHWFAGIALAGLLSASLASAAEPKKSEPAAPSAEQREKMAAVHQKMAECLRSDRPMSECRAEMDKSCQEMMGDSGCPMMGAGQGGMGPGMMGHGKGSGMHGGMMQGKPAPETPEKK
jgi:hypothetical protein